MRGLLPWRIVLVARLPWSELGDTVLYKVHVLESGGVMVPHHFKAALRPAHAPAPFHNALLFTLRNLDHACTPS